MHMVQLFILFFKLIFLLFQCSQDCLVNIYRILLISLQYGRMKQSSEVDNGRKIKVIKVVELHNGNNTCC